jgi:hypothetical protein
MNFNLQGPHNHSLESLERCTGTSVSESEKVRKWTKTSLFEGRAMII